MAVKSVKPLHVFNAGFGITYKSDRLLTNMVKPVRTTKADNLMKLISSIPILGLGMIIFFKKNYDIAGKERGRALLARGILCGLGVGIPIVLALDIIASVSTQIHQARKLR